MKPIHTCSCGRSYTQGEWFGLPLVSVERIPAGEDGPAFWMEQRNCPCGSTRAIEIPDPTRVPAAAHYAYIGGGR